MSGLGRLQNKQELALDKERQQATQYLQYGWQKEVIEHLEYYLATVRADIFSIKHL
jgi:hypothetical protein